MSEFGEKLKRKIGPLPTWAWILIGGIAVYWWRRRNGGGGSNIANNSSVAPGPSANPAAGTVLQPGESVVGSDGSLQTAPGSADGNASDPSAAITQALQPLLDALNQLESQPPPSDGAPGAPGAPGKPGKSGRDHKRKAKTKPGHTEGHTKGTPLPQTKRRSPATVRHLTGGRFGRKAVAQAQSIGKRTTSPTASSGTRRQRPLSGAVRKTAPVQHTVATHPRATTRPIIQSPPRPSSPLPRTTRIPVTKHAPPKGKKR